MNYRPCRHSSQNEPFNFTHLIFVSRVYKLTPEEEDAMTIARQQPGKASKRQKSQNSNEETNDRSPDGVYPFHPEDEEIRKVHPFIDVL